MNYELTLSSLQDKGARITRFRKEIVKIFSSFSVPFSVNQLSEYLSKKKIMVDRATIYREVKYLLRNGYIIEVYIYPNEICYESSEYKHHHHLVCNKCGKIDNVTNCIDSELEERIYKKRGFKVKKHILEFYGTCAKCLKT